MTIADYCGYQLMAIVSYFINCLLLIILLMPIGAYFINAYWCLFY
jgi:hypothetical protein